MMMRLRKRLAAIIAAALFAVYIMCVINVNRKYPQTEVRVVDMNKPIEYQGLEISVTDTHIMEDTDIDKYFSGEKEHYGGCIGIVADILIENSSSDEKKIDLTSLIFESGAWKNAIHYVAFSKINAENKKMSLNPVLQSGERIELRLPTFVVPVHMRQSQWEDFLKRNVYLTFSLYPEKLMVRLH